MKCTLCYDRLQSGLEPACSKACPTSRSNFGPIDQLHQMANARVEQLNTQAQAASQPQQAYLYGGEASLLGGLNSFYLLVDRPEVYGLPSEPKLPPRTFRPPASLGAGGALGMAVLGAVTFRKRRMDDFAAARAAEADEAQGGEEVAP